MKHPGYTRRTMSERRTHGGDLLSTLVTNRYDSKHGYEPPSVHHPRDTNHRREDEGQETTDLDAQSYETWYPSPSDETTPAIQDLPSTTVSPVNEPTPDVSMASLTHSPLKVLNMTNVPNKLPHPLASNLIMPPQAGPTGTAKPTPQTQQTPPERILLTLFVTGGVVFLIIWAAIRLGSCKRPRWRWRRPIPSLPTVRDKERTQGDSGLEIPLSLSRKQNHTLPQRIYNCSQWTQTNCQSGIPRLTPPATMGRSTSQGMLDNANVTSGQEVNKHAEQDQYPFTGAGNCASSSAPPTQPPPSTATPIMSRLSTVSMSLQPNSSDYSQLGSEIGLAIDTPTGPDQGQKLVSWSSVRSLTRAVRGAAVQVRRSAASFVTSDSQTNAAIGRALIKTTYYTPSPYPRESTPSPSHSQCMDEHDSQQERGLERSKTQRGQERSVQIPIPELSSLVSSLSRPPLETDDAMEVIEGATNAVSAYSQNQPASSSDITNGMIVDPAAPTSLSAASIVSTPFCTSEGELPEESRGLLAGTLPHRTSKEVEVQPPRERPLPPTPLDQTYTNLGSMAADDDSATNGEGEICTSTSDG